MRPLRRILKEKLEACNKLRLGTNAEDGKILDRTFPTLVHPNTSELEWKSKDKRVTKIRDMDSRHIINTIKMIEEERHFKKVGSKEHLALQAEVKFRKSMVGIQVEVEPEERLSPGGIFYES